MEIEKLSGNYIKGYTRAIMDIVEIFDYINNDLRYHKKRLNDKLAKELLQCVLTNRERIREERDGFIRWNCVENKFEWFKRSE